MLLIFGNILFICMTELSKTEIKEIIRDELDKAIRGEIKRLIKNELSSLVSSNRDIKDEIAEISKEIFKKVYKDISYHHTYVIDRVKL